MPHPDANPGAANRTGRRRFLALTGATLAGLATGCHGTYSPNTGDGFVESVDARDVVVKPDVVVLPADGSVTLVARDDDSLALRGAPAIAPGNVLVSALGTSGLLRRVLAVVDNGDGTIRVSTADATYEDVFASADITIRRTLRPSDFARIETLGPSTTIGGSRATDSRGRAVSIPMSTKFKVGRDGFLKDALDADQSLSVAVEVELQGALTFDLEFDLKIDSNGLRRVLCAVKVGFNASKASVTGKLALRFFRMEAPYATFIGAPLVFFIGPVPIVILPVLFLQAAIEGRVEGNLQFVGSCDASVRAGFEFLRGGGVSPVLDDTFRGDIITPVALFAEILLEATPLQPELTTSFNGISGPFVKASLPAFKLALRGNFDPNNGTPGAVPIPQTVDVTLDTRMKGSIGAKAGLFGGGFPLFELTAETPKLEIFKKTFKTGQSQLEVK